jgi:hypothetical protein
VQTAIVIRCLHKQMPTVMFSYELFHKMQGFLGRNYHFWIRKRVTTTKVEIRGPSNPRQTDVKFLRNLMFCSSRIQMCWSPGRSNISLQTALHSTSPLHSLCPLFALHALEIYGSSILFLHRLCIPEPSTYKLKTLAFCHALYYACVKDPV